MRRIALLAVAAGFLVPLLASAPASAQATRTWVSGVGDDANPCSRTAPCKTFAGAISKTAPAGTINCLDPGGFGGVTITKAMNIRCVGLEAGVLVSGVNGIVVAAGASDTVTLDGLDIEGLNSGPNGVLINSGKEVYILNSRIHQFTQNGVTLNNTAGVSRVIVHNSFIHNNGVGGINVTGPSNVATVTSSTISSAGNFGLQANGAGTVVAVANSTLNISPTAVSPINGGSVISFGPSSVVSGAGVFTNTNAFK